MTKQAYLGALLARVPSRFRAWCGYAAQRAIHGEGRPLWRPQSKAARAAWRAIGGKGRVTMKKLRNLK